jgi:dTDP-4-dehydrorhamnose 3,5-epimerase
MRFTELPLKGAFVVEMEANHDERGYFARTFCTKEFEKQGLVSHFVQCSTSHNLHKGLIRGLHFQAAPYQETKLVRCTQGAIFDVIVDLRKDSPTYKECYGLELTATNGKMLYIPKDFAHGFQVLENKSDVFYMMDEFYVPQAAREMSPFSGNIKTPLWPLTIGP